MNHQHTAQLVDGYNRMMERIKSIIDNATEETPPTLKTAMDRAIRLALEQHELGRREAELIASTIRQDLNAAAEELMETNKEFTEWLAEDVDVVEQRVLTLFLATAHHTRHRINQFRKNHQH